MVRTASSSALGDEITLIHAVSCIGRALGFDGIARSIIISQKHQHFVERAATGDVLLLQGFGGVVKAAA